MATPKASGRIFGGRPSGTAETRRAAKPGAPCTRLSRDGAGSRSKPAQSAGRSQPFSSRCPREQGELESLQKQNAKFLIPDKRPSCLGHCIFGRKPDQRPSEPSEKPVLPESRYFRSCDLRSMIAAPAAGGSYCNSGSPQFVTTVERLYAGVSSNIIK